MALPPQALAVDLGQWVPGLKVAPFVTERVEYETNVFQTRNTNDDLIFRTIPGVAIDYAQGPLTLSAGYRAEILKFLDLTSQDNTHHIASGQINLDLPKLTLNLRDDFTRTSDPPTTELVGRVESRTNVLHPEAKYKLTDRFSVGTDFSWTNVSFPTVKELDRNEYLYGGTLYRDVTEKFSVGLNYGYGEKKFQRVIRPEQPNRDVTRNLAGVRLRGDITPKITAGFSVGYERRAAEAKNQPSESGLVFGGDWVYRITDRARLTLFANRAFEEATSQGANGRGLFFRTTSGTVTLDQQITEKLTAFLRGAAVDDEYEGKRSSPTHLAFAFRNDNIYRWGGGLDYQIQKWLSLGAEFAHTTRGSNFREFNYKDDKITGKITLQF